MTQIDVVEEAAAVVARPARGWRPYPAYRASGVDWLGEIPAHWQVKRLKHIAKLTYGESLAAEDREEGDVPVFGSNGSVGMHSTANTFGPCLVIGRKGSYGKVSYSDVSCFVIDTAFFIDRTQAHLNMRWLYYALQCLGLDAVSQDTGVPGLSREIAHNQMLPSISLAEQHAIAAFLDRETARIDALAAKKERLIALLREKRAALISHAVTRGLDADAPMKESGVAWLGRVPAHWEVMRLKFLLRAIEQGWSPECENRLAGDDEWGVLKVGCVNGTAFNELEHKALPSGIEPDRSLEIHPGDILMSRANTRELLGSASVVGCIRPRLLLCDKLYRLTVQDERIDAEFLAAALGSAVARYQFEREATGASSSMKNIAQTTVKELLLALPEPMEQQAIMAGLRERTDKLDTLISKVRQHIEKLKEYRAALIAAAVTGKLDVRAAGAARGWDGREGDGA